MPMEYTTAPISKETVLNRFVKNRYFIFCRLSLT